MRNITTIAPMSPMATSGFGMPMHVTTPSGRTFVGVERGFRGTGLSVVCTTDLGADATQQTRARSFAATKGHVALVAYIPGIRAWSPPI